MEDISALVQIEYSKTFPVPTAYRTPVWRYLIWTRYEKKLPFMADTDDYPAVRINIGTVYINHEAYVRVHSEPEIFVAPKRYYVVDNMIYIHFEGHSPPYIFAWKRHGAIDGFSDGGALILEGFSYLPDVTGIPSIAESADPLTYTKMRFNSGTYEFNNTKGMFDSVSDIFGNRLNVLVGKKGWTFEKYRKVMQYYISNISFGLEKAAVEVKDTRELLSVKVPTGLYTREEYPHLNDSDVDKVKQDAYGYCFNVKGTCTNWNDAYVDEYNTLRTDRTFRFARAIKEHEIEYIEIKQGGSQIDGAPTSNKNQDVGWTRFVKDDFPAQGIYVYADGTITIDYYKIFPLKNGIPDIAKKTYEVRATGTFVDIHNPGAIIKDIMSHYGEIQVDQVFDNTEFDAELGKLPQIGICLDRQEEIYAVIEKIQKGSLLGFQFMGKYDKYTARLDNPNRARSAVISSEDIINLDEIEVNMNADLYATYTDIKYAKKWYVNKDDEEEYLHVINKSKRLDILDIHRLDKAHEEELLVKDPAVAALKGEIMLEDFSEIRPVISGIKLFGLKWFDLRIYDIIDIDFVFSGEKVDAVSKNLIKLFSPGVNEQIISLWADDEEIIVMDTEKAVRNNREFIGRLRCQILGREIDTATGTVTLSVRQRDRSAYLGEAYD